MTDASQRCPCGSGLSYGECCGPLHAGTRRREDGSVVSSGGRVLSIVGVGADLEAAREAVYRRVERVHLTGSHHRADIALRAARGEIAVPAAH